MGNRVLQGFTIRNPDGLGQPQNFGTLLQTSKGHGQACAGIIAASNNTIGIRGIASNVNVLPINIVPDFVTFDYWGNPTSTGFGTNIEIAEAINWAWRRADILSCSWGGGSFSNDIMQAIDSARNFGRDGRGTIVVFASGNSWGHINITDVAFPGNVDGVITVGAINNKGTIWNYSQRGNSMDLVAPSGNVNLQGNIYTTDRMGNLGYNNTNYISNFGGTSAACPQVAGVAALILSVRPDLTEAQVRTTLQNTARDLGSVGFDNTYGYGLVNAHAAVYAVAPRLTGPSSICSQATYTINNLPTGATVNWNIHPELSIVSQSANSITVEKSQFPPLLANAWVTANITTSAFNTFTVGKYNIVIWKPGTTESNSLITGDLQSWGGQVEIPFEFLNYGAYDVTWSCSTPNWTPNIQGANFTVFDGQNVTGDVYITVSFKNPCGQSTTIYKKFFIPENQYYKVYPNPSSTNINISLKEDNIAYQKDAGKIPTFDQIIISDITGNIKLKQNVSKTNRLQVDVSRLPNGIYYLNLYNEGKLIEKKTIQIAK